MRWRLSRVHDEWAILGLVNGLTFTGVGTVLLCHCGHADKRKGNEQTGLNFHRVHLGNKQWPPRCRMVSGMTPAIIDLAVLTRPNCVGGVARSIHTAR